MGNQTPWMGDQTPWAAQGMTKEQYAADPAAQQRSLNGQGPAAPASSTVGTIPGGPDTNTAQSNPDLNYVIGQEKKRYEGDMGAGRSIDIAGQKIREAALGGKSALDADVSRRVGGGGGGLGDILRTRYEGGTQRAVAGAATDIAENANQAREGVLRDIASAGSSQAGINLADRNLALQQQQQMDADRRAAQQAQDQQLKDLISEITGIDSSGYAAAAGTTGPVGGGLGIQLGGHVT